MKKIKYTKINGAGNDFVLIDRKLNPDFEISDEIVKKLSDRDNGIGSDGVIVIDDSSQYDFEMLYYNADGSGGALCANGARCAIKYANITGRISGKADFISNGEIYSGEILSENEIKFYLNQPKKIKLDFKIKALNQLINASYLDVGSRHVVVFINDVLSDVKKMNTGYKELDNFPVYEVGKEIRYAPEFAPGGVNVNFINIENDKIFIRTYERGVEKETLACGSGSVSSAIVAFLKKKLNPPFKLVTKSNSVLTVNFDFDIENQNFVNLALSGAVEINFNSEYSI